jgi:NAD(P)-dependent dehydrogenase (short-subunit alcohol dehydrogenase family)
MNDAVQTHFCKANASVSTTATVKPAALSALTDLVDVTVIQHENGAVDVTIGNGRATAILFAREGARVVVVDRDLARARDTAATALFGRRALDVLHRLYGTAAGEAATTEATPIELPPPVPAWSEPDGIVLDDHAISHAWDTIRARHGVTGAVRFERTASARPRTFVVQPRGEIVVVIPAQIATPVARFSILHELGHVLAALALPAGIPRLVDEAAAAYLARMIERPDDGAGAWYSAVAGPARVRRHRLARVLDRIERALPAIVEPAVERPPWAVWHDPGAQAAYVAAEALADEIERDIGAVPAPGALAEALAARREPIDRLDTLLV